MKLPSWLRRDSRPAPYRGPEVCVLHEGLYLWVSRMFFTDTIYLGMGEFAELEMGLRQIPEVTAVRIYTHYVAIEWGESDPTGDIDEVLEHKNTQILSVLGAYFETLPLELRVQPPLNERPLHRTQSLAEVHRYDYQQLWLLGNDKDKLSDWHRRDDWGTRSRSD